MPSTESVANSDVFLWALYDLGGAEKFVDVEEVYFRAFTLAPERLSWRTRPLPDLKKCAKSLQEAEVRRPKLLVKNGSYLRMLSADGQKWIEDNFDRLVEVLDPGTKVQPPRQRRSSRLVSLAVNSDLFRQWQDTNQVPAEKWQLADLLNCSPDSAAAVWDRRYEELRSAAHLASNRSLLNFLESLKSEHKEWFGDDQ